MLFLRIGRGSCRGRRPRYRFARPGTRSASRSSMSCNGASSTGSWALFWAIGVDEIQYAEGPQIPDAGVPDRTAVHAPAMDRSVADGGELRAVLRPDLTSWPDRLSSVCSDMWQPYLTVIRERCSQAIHILDRFDIVAKMNTALDDVRAAEARRLARDGYEPVLKKTRWCVLKHRANLTRHQRFRLRDLLRYNLRTVRAYLLKEDFQQLWDKESPSWAGKFLMSGAARLCARASSR